MKNQYIFNRTALYRWLCSCGVLLMLFMACKKDNTEPVKVLLAVTDYYPNSGNKGTLVTVEGTGFSNNIDDISATFSGARADIVSASSTAVVMRAPASGASGDIIIKTNEESVTVGKYTYQDLSVQKISPANGAAGTHISISGTGFGSLSGPAEVYINEKLAIVVSASDTLLVAEVPAAAGSGPVTVKVNGKEASGQTFKFQSVTAIKPLTGGKGTRVRITGSGFDEVIAGNYVDFNGKAALVEEAAESYLVVIAPEGVSTGPLAVTVSSQKVTGPVFTVVPYPVIQQVTPLSGPAGAVMTITGTTFSPVADENKVTINGVNVPITAATATTITLTLPGGTGSGKIAVNVNDQVTQGPDFKDQSLGILKLSPEGGLAGTKVTITGTGFSTTPGQNIVTFNGTVATVLSATATSLVVTAPEGFTSGPLKVVTNSLTAVAPVNFNHAGVVTLAGGAGNSELSLSTFRSGSLAVDSKGNVFVTEVDFSRIKKIAPNGTVTLFAGSPTGARGSSDGQGTAALFSFGTNPGMDIDENDNLFISDGPNVRKVTPQGTVSTFATGLNATNKIAFDEQGILYVLGSFNGGWKIDKAGIKTAVNFNGLLDAARPAIVNNIVYKVNNEGMYVDQVTIATGVNLFRWVGSSYGYTDGIGNAAMFSSINGLVADRAGHIYVSDYINHAIRQINIATKEVTTVVQFGSGTNVDGPLNEAKAGSIGDITIDKSGAVYFIDMTNNAVRKVFLK